jgi:hypothetical protein
VVDSGIVVVVVIRGPPFGLEALEWFGDWLQGRLRVCGLHYKAFIRHQQVIFAAKLWHLYVSCAIIRRRTNVAREA